MHHEASYLMWQAAKELSSSHAASNLRYLASQIFACSGKNNQLHLSDDKNYTTTVGSR